MATAQQIKSLLRCHANRDNEGMVTVALQIAAEESRKGHSSLADEIGKIIQEIQHLSPKPAPGILVPATGLPAIDAVEFVQPQTHLSQMVLPEQLRNRLGRIIREHRNDSRLMEYFLRPRRRLLLVGPPGCGKTMTAHAMAHELSLPLGIVRMDALMSKYLGETVAKLRTVFDLIESHRAVYLFDEFDSLGLARGSGNDVAEMRRVLNSFLVFLENTQGTSLVIAATNHEIALDPALFRRFEDIVRYELPTSAEIIQVMRNNLSFAETKEINWKKIEKNVHGFSHAEAAAAATDAFKNQLLDNRQHVTTEDMLTAINERKNHLQIIN
jgi:SpoVK/Ycf46/Vps4 family AAA+-type ATPase